MNSLGSIIKPWPGVYSDTSGGHHFVTGDELCLVVEVIDERQGHVKVLDDHCVIVSLYESKVVE